MAITNVPEIPNASLRVQLGISQGINQLQRSLGSGVGLYQSTDAAIKQEVTEIAPFGVFNSNANDTIETLIVVTNVPLTLNGRDLQDNFVSFEVNRLLVLDSSLKSFSLSNGDTAKARVQIYMIAKQRSATANVEWYGVAVPPSVADSTFVQSLTQVLGEKNRTFTVNAAAGEKIYYAYPSALGLASFTLNGFVTAFELKPVIFITVDGLETAYYVYESVEAGLGSATVTVTNPL